MNFETASQKVKCLKQKPTDQQLLLLYGLYKQATVGNCNIPEPWIFQTKEHAKWFAWNRQKEKQQIQCKTEYKEIVLSLIRQDKLLL